MAMPPSWVAEKRAYSPGSRLFTRRSARGRRRPPSTITIASLAMAVTSLVQEGRRDARAVLDEVLHADVHVDGGLAAAEPARLDREPLAQRPREPIPQHVDEDL